MILMKQESGGVKAAFLDRDGVINELIYHQDIGIIDSPFTVEQFRLLPRVGEAIRLLKEGGFKVVVVSNQPGVAKNHFSEETLFRMSERMEQQLALQGAYLDGIYYCRHHPEAENELYRQECSCRKPKPGLLLQAAHDLNIDLNLSHMVGDSVTDVKAGCDAGCSTVLLGRPKCETCHLMDEEGIKADSIAGDLFVAVTTILGGRGCSRRLHDEACTY